jgi:hypothetical protein
VHEPDHLVQHTTILLEVSLHVAVENLHHVSPAKEDESDDLDALREVYSGSGIERFDV